jgi:nucleoside-diphosphate-sugar epimerase
MERDLSACGLPLRAIQEGEGKGRGEMAEEGNRRVLVVGGSGYLGQHLLAALASDAGRLDVAFTHHSQAPPQALLDALPPSVRAFRADLRSGDGFEAISASFGQVRVCISSGRY